MRIPQASIMSRRNTGVKDLFILFMNIKDVRVLFAGIAESAAEPGAKGPKPIEDGISSRRTRAPCYILIDSIHTQTTGKDGVS